MSLSLAILLLTQPLAAPLAELQQDTAHTNTVPASPPAYDIYRAGAKSHANGPGEFILRNPSEWAQYWQANFSSAVPTNVNFDRSMYLAVHLGRRGSTGYTVAVSSVMTGPKGEMRVTFAENLPRPHVKILNVATSPYMIIRLNKSDAPVLVQGIVTGTGAIDQPGYAAGDCFPRRTYLTGMHSLLKKPQAEVIDSQEDLNALWSRAFGHDTQAPTTNDFKTTRLVAISLGQCPTPGYEITLARLARIGPHEVQVQYYKTSPARGSILPQMITNPFVIYEIPRTDDTVTTYRVRNPLSAL